VTNPLPEFALRLLHPQVLYFLEKQNMSTPDRLLERHYKTIGIHDVFLSPAPHPLLSSYLKKESCHESFPSWEIVGTIKKTPEDFIVREIFQSERKIPGLTDDDMKTLRVAGLPGPGKRPHQQLNSNDQKDQPQPTNNVNTDGDETRKAAETGSTESKNTSDESNDAFLEAYLQRIIATRKDIDPNLMSSLKKVHQIALERMKNIASSGNSPQPINAESELQISAGTFDSTSETALQELGEVTQALQKKFPLLHLETANKNETELWIRATIDGSYDELIPYLYSPEEDLSSLLLFQKQRVEGPIEGKKPTDINSTDDNDHVILRLRPGIAKVERRNIFDLILSKCAMFATKTLAEYPLPKEENDGTIVPETSVAIAVSWKKDESPVAILQAYMQRAAATRKDLETDLISSLNKLQQIALERIPTIASGVNDQPANDESDSVWIPPATSDSTSEIARQERGTVFQALKMQFPLLQSDGTIKNENERWIRVTIDVSYDAIVPYLHLPVEDLRSLLLFQKQGIEGVKEKIKLQKKGQPDGRNTGDEANQVILRLRPHIAKDERRKIHNLIASKCKMFATTTLADYPLSPQGEKAEDKTTATTTALVVSWQKHALQRGSRKRKRNDGNQSKVTEASQYPNLLCVVKKRQKEHLAMLQRLTETIRCRQADVGIAGIKDMQAVTYQFCTIRNTKTHRVLSILNQLERNGIEVDNFYRVDWTLNNGDLDGNEFEIRIRNLKRIRVTAVQAGPADESIVACEPDHITAMVERIQKHGFINFFGPQRVGAPGESGATAFLIGKAMLQEKFQSAIDLLMMGRAVFHREGQQENDSARRVRRIWKETGDPKAALQALGGGDLMPRERAVLKGLNRYGKDQPLQALQCLSHSMRMFYINAYQSYVWNQVASKRIAKYGTQVVRGDLYVEKDDVILSNVKVVQGETVSSSLSLDQIVLPLPGYRVRYPENDIGELYKTILDQDGVKFEKSAPPEATAKGAYRRLIVHPGAIDAEVENGDGVNVRLTFQLPKGSYATMLLRELMVTTATRNNN
jgi:TruD family tRNA pseudouridine synthase